MAFNFQTRGAKLAAKGAAMANGGPVRMKKKNNFFQSINGALIGILLVLGSPYVMWMSANQNTAKEFATAEIVDASSAVEGYITTRGVPSYADEDDGLDCWATDCLYEVESDQMLVTNEELICRQTVQEDDMTRVLYQNGVECDDETGECVPCWQVEVDSWEEQSETVRLYDVAIGSYTATPTESAIYFDTEEDIVETDFDLFDEERAIARTVYTSFVMPGQLLIAGQSDGSHISQPSEDAYVISKYDHGTTMVKLEERDAQNRLMLRVMAFVFLFVGFGLIFGPIEWAGRLFGKIPGIGPMVSQGSKGLIAAVSFGLALVFWIV